MEILLVPDGPLDAGATLARYRLWGEDPATRLADGRLCRVLRLDGRLWPYELRWDGPPDAVRLRVRVAGARAARVRDAVVAEVGRLLGLGFDLRGFYTAARGDPVLGALVGPLYGLRPTLAPTALEMLVGAIAAQQVNLRFAATLRARLVRRFGTPVDVDGAPLYAFPEATTLARVRVETLRALQFSTRKGAYVVGVARALARGRLDPVALAAAPSEEVVATLTALPGLGRWSAEWFLARYLGRGAVCPAGDLAVRKTFARHYGQGGPIGEDAIRRRAAAWGPHQNLAIHYLLAALRLDGAATGGGT